jgi:hypothetical protein
VFYGGLIAALAVAVWYMRKTRLPGWKTADVFAPAIALGHGIGRIGCFSAGCCWGVECHRPWAVTFTSPVAHETVGVPLNIPLHPTQLYEAFAEFAIFGFLYWRIRKPHGDGGIIGAYLMLYSRRRGSRWSSSGYTSRGMCWAGRSTRRSGSPRACFCWARLVSGDSAERPRRPAAKLGRLYSRLLAFCGLALAQEDGRGCAALAIRAFLTPAGALRGGDARSALGIIGASVFQDGFPCALGCRGRGRSLSQHAAQFRHLRFNLLEVLLVTYQRRFQGRFVKTNGHIRLIIGCAGTDWVISFTVFLVPFRIMEYCYLI